MEFLPLEKEGGKVYAGFWKRLPAALIDTLVLIPLIFVFHYIQSINIIIAMIAAVIFSFLFSLYGVYFNLKYGGTLGKLAVGIRVTKPNGQKISLREALLRSSVDIVFGLLFTASEVYAISRVDPDAYLMAGYMERGKLLIPLYLEYSKFIYDLSNVWYWSEMVVLLLNKRKRALHDFIAGTVVIKKAYEKIT